MESRHEEGIRTKRSFLYPVQFSLSLWIISTLLFTGTLYVNHFSNAPVIKIDQPVSSTLLPSPTLTFAPTIATKNEDDNNKTITIAPKVVSTEEWGVAKQVDDVTWTIRLQQDERMATPEEILAALNIYRNRHGAGPVMWEQNLANYALERAHYFNTIHNLDKHEGFKQYLQSEENVRRLGFSALGENSGYGYRLLGVHLIEWVFAGDKPHDDNQRDPTWTHVGIGVESTGVDIIFGKNRI